MSNTTMAVNGLPVSVRDRARWSPASHPERTYILAPLGVRERAAMRLAIVADYGTYPNDREMREMLREAALACLEPDEAAQVCGEVEELSVLEESGDQQEPEVLELLADLRKKTDRWLDRLSRESRPLSRLIAARWAWIDAVSVYSVRWSIRGWEGIGVPCVRRNGMVLEEAMEAIEDDLEELVTRCRPLREVSVEQEPDSASP